MLLSNEINDLAVELKDEAQRRPYITALLPGLAQDENFWRMIMEVLEIILHRGGYVIVKRGDATRVVGPPSAER